MTQGMLVSSGATECFHGLELPTQGEGSGVYWKAVLWEGGHPHRVLETGAGCLLTRALPWGGREVRPQLWLWENRQGSRTTQAQLTETQPAEIPGGKPRAEALRGASLHPAPHSLPCRAV